LIGGDRNVPNAGFFGQDKVSAVRCARCQPQFVAAGRGIQSRLKITAGRHNNDPIG
jgi:hypothetical protein